MGPTLLIDNDALLKSAHWSLLDVVPTLVNGSWSEAACLPAFLPRVRRAEAKLFANANVAKELEERLQVTTQLPDPDVRTLSILQGLPGIDVGEQLLFASLTAAKGAQLLTGDKRALRRLAISAARQGCEGRVICVEQLLWHALDALGSEALLHRVRRWTPRDQAALAIFGRQGEKSDADLRDGLRSYLMSLDGEASGLLTRRFGLGLS